MIKYNLKCEKGHNFDSWFASSEAFEKLLASKHLQCVVCDSVKITKTLMTPTVSKSNKNKSQLRTPASLAEKALKDLRKKIEETSENVGEKFEDEARAIHDGLAPARSIYGTTSLKSAKSLAEDGVEIIPLPWTDRKTN